ncbi:hypothetical protein BSKO_07204 [Bryopsis sp. KO-2023]|nr:hypothetical protein BSKO_07204 [Bryopsis sp. KO-2023]
MVRNGIPLLVVVLVGLRTVGGLDPTYSSALLYETCEASFVATPQTVLEVQEVVKDAREANLTVKVVGNRLSATDIFCTDGVAVDMSNFQQVDVDAENGLVTVGSGANFQRLHSELARAGYSTIHPGGKFGGVSVGGALSTGTHSSSLNHPSTLADQAISMTLVNGLGEVVVATGDVLDATAIGIGAVGVIVDVTLEIFPNFKIRMENKAHNESFMLNGEVIEMARGRDYLALSWFPSTNSVVSTSGTYLPDLTTPGNDVANYAFEKNPGSMAFSRRVEQAQADKNNKFFCDAEKGNVESWVTGKTGVKVFVNETGDFQNPAVGVMTNLLSQYCPVGGGCGWEGEDAFLSHEVEIAIDLELFPAAIKRMKAFVESRRFCLLTLNGIGIRFGKQSTRHISPASSSEVAWFEIVTPLRQDYTLAFHKMGVYAELAQILYMEFGGRSHWGKGGNAMFINPYNPPSVLYPRWDKFLSARQELDPEGVFENEFIRRMLGTSRIKKTKYCAVYDQCVCGKNSHCPDTHRCKTKGDYGINYCTEKQTSRKMTG